MPVKVRKIKTFKSINLIDNPNPTNLDLSKCKEITTINPFNNLLEMVDCYLSIFVNQDIETLTDFVIPPNSDKEPKIICSLEMYKNFIPSMCFSASDPAEDDEWLIFDFKKLDELLKHSFFDEYNKTLPFLKNYYSRSYPLLDVYSFIRLQAYASTVLPQDLLNDVNYIWNYEDFIDYIYGYGWFDTISIIYKSYGIHWFASKGTTDCIMYKWAYYAVSACKKNNAISDSVLKRDLNNMCKEFIIACTIRGTIDKYSETIDYLQSCITKFDEERINGLIDKVKNLEEQNEKLIDEKKQLKEGIELLRNQIKEMQTSLDNSDSDSDFDFDKIEDIVYRIYSLSPQNTDLEDKVDNFKTVWNKLDDITKKDIKLSISMFENFDSFDLALFPMIRSLEYEFARNFFAPFHSSEIYLQIETPMCIDKKYEKTHEALIKQGHKFPTMGSIPFIGRAICDDNAQKSSNIINAFSIYLGTKRLDFSSICKSLDTYRLGTKKYKLVDIRNGIAHGYNKITQYVDKKVYKEVSKLLYEPPLQILFEIIKYSMKNE